MIEGEPIRKIPRPEPGNRVIRINQGPGSSAEEFSGLAEDSLGIQDGNTTYGMDIDELIAPQPGIEEFLVDVDLNKPVRVVKPQNGGRGQRRLFSLPRIDQFRRKHSRGGPR